MGYQITNKEKKYAYAIILIFAVSAVVFPYTFMNISFGNFSHNDIHISQEITNDNRINCTELYFNLNLGDITIKYVDNNTLLVKAEFQISQKIYETYGTPELVFNNNKINVTYYGADLTLTLSKSVKYDIKGNIDTGNANIIYNNNSTISNTSISINTGSIVSYITKEVLLTGNISINYTVNTGSIRFNLETPTSVGSKVSAIVDTGEISINSSNYTFDINTDTVKICKNTDYNTASIKWYTYLHCITGEIYLILS